MDIDKLIGKLKQVRSKHGNIDIEFSGSSDTTIDCIRVINDTAILCSRNIITITTADVNKILFNYFQGRFPDFKSEDFYWDSENYYLFVDMTNKLIGYCIKDSYIYNISEKFSCLAEYIILHGI